MCKFWYTKQNCSLSLNIISTIIHTFFPKKLSAKQEISRKEMRSGQKTTAFYRSSFVFTNSVVLSDIQLSNACTGYRVLRKSHNHHIWIFVKYRCDQSFSITSTQKYGCVRSEYWDVWQRSAVQLQIKQGTIRLFHIISAMLHYVCMELNSAKQTTTIEENWQ